MKTSRIILMTLITCIAIFLYICFKPVWDYGHLEKNARRAITGAELQTWATNILAHYTNDTDLTISELGTNFPSQLTMLAPKLGPSIYVRVLGTNEPPFVQLSWGSGMLGGAGFYIGSTNFAYLGMDNFTDYTNQSNESYFHVWRPGVWFYQDYGR